MVRPRIGTNEGLFLEFYEAGYNDSQISQYLGVSRTTVARKRCELGLNANSRRGLRGMGLHEGEEYWRYVARVYSRNKELARIIRQISLRLFSQGHVDYFTYYLCMGTEPANIQPFTRIPYRHGTSKMIFSNLQKILEYEKKVDQSALVGVPGPAFIQLARVFKSASDDHIIALAEEAVKGAGFINADTRVGQDFECIPASLYENFWADIKAEVGDWWTSLPDVSCGAHTGSREFDTEHPQYPQELFKEHSVQLG